MCSIFSNTETIYGLVCQGPVTLGLAHLVSVLAPITHPLFPCLNPKP